MTRGIGRFVRSFAVALFMMGTGAAVLACPVCNTETGQQVREGIFGEAFLLNALAVMAPVPILLLAAMAVTNRLGREESGS